MRNTLQARTSSRFSVVQETTLDNIMRLDELFREDPDPRKINLVVGVYKTDEGTTPVLRSVKEAERRIVDTEPSKSYVPMNGEAAFLSAAQALVFGDSALGREARLASVHAPGGTGSLRLAGEFIREHFAAHVIWLGEPAYPNHRGLFEPLGIRCEPFRYFDRVEGAIREDEMFEDLARARRGDFVLLHACCHNPSGADPSPEGWQRLARFLAERGLVPLVDVAYLGYADGLEHDAGGVRTIFEHCAEGLVTVSFSKNFSLYNERTGLLIYVGADAGEARRCAARTRTYIRRLWTSPPAHGARIVTTILNDRDLRDAWVKEVEEMRLRMKRMRVEISAALQHLKVDMQLFPALVDLKGMFTLTRLSEAQVTRLREDEHIYMLPNGRISITGLTSSSVERVAKGIAAVVQR